MTFLPWFLPRKEPPVQLREVGPNRGHLVIEIYSDVPLHLCRCRTGDKDCCGCSVGHRRQNITACTGVTFTRLRTLQRSVLQQHRVFRQHVLLLLLLLLLRTCSNTKWGFTGSHPTESLMEQNCVGSGY